MTRPISVEDMTLPELFDEHESQCETLKRHYKKELEKPLSKRKSNKLLSLMTALYADKPRNNIVE